MAKETRKESTRGHFERFRQKLTQVKSKEEIAKDLRKPLKRLRESRQQPAFASPNYPHGRRLSQNRCEELVATPKAQRKRLRGRNLLPILKTTINMSSPRRRTRIVQEKSSQPSPSTPASPTTPNLPPPVNEIEDPLLDQLNRLSLVAQPPPAAPIPSHPQKAFFTEEIDRYAKMFGTFEDVKQYFAVKFRPDGKRVLICRHCPNVEHSQRKVLVDHVSMKIAFKPISYFSFLEVAIKKCLTWNEEMVGTYVCPYCSFTRRSDAAKGWHEFNAHLKNIEFKFGAKKEDDVEKIMDMLARIPPKEWKRLVTETPAERRENFEN